MNAQERENWRWRFAGQAMAALAAATVRDPEAEAQVVIDASIQYANDLVAELLRTQPSTTKFCDTLSTEEQAVIDNATVEALRDEP